MRIHLRPRRGRPRRRHPARHRLRGHPERLVLPGLRRPQEGLRALRAVRWPAPVRRGVQPRRGHRGAPGRVADPAAGLARRPRGPARPAQSRAALHGRRVGLPGRRGSRRRGRRPRRHGGPRARGGGRHRPARRRGAGAVLALDHARAGEGPLRHLVLRRARAAGRRGAARRERVRGRALARARPPRSRPTRRTSWRSSSPRSSTSSCSPRAPRWTRRSPPRGRARWSRSCRRSRSATARAQVLLPGEPGYDDA